MFAFINNLKVSVKLTGLAIILATLPAVLQAIVSYTTAENSMRADAITKLEAIQAGRISELERWIQGIEQDLLFQAENVSVIEALKAFDAGFQEFGDDALFQLQKLYISDNPNPTGEKEKLDFAPDGSAYSQTHAYYHPGLRAFLNARGYYDVFLFNTEGDLVYSVFKELDYATNVISGEWRATDLANAFKAADRSRAPGSVHFFDFKPYGPSADAPASFISTPVFEDGRYIGVLVYQMPIGTLNTVMQQADGLGATGETYAVGADLLMRSDSRFSDGQDILSTRVEKDSITLALSGQSGVSVGENYRGQRVLSTAAPFTYRGATWALVAEMGLDEVNAAAIQLRNRSLILLVIIAGLFSSLGWFLARSLSQPLTRMIQTMDDLAEGNLDTSVPAQDREDEIGMMAKALGVFRDGAQRARALEAEQAETAARAAEEKKQAMANLADAFEKSVGGIVFSVGEAAAQMETAAQSLSALAGQTARSLSGAQRSAEEASMNTDTVASAAEELSASISEISRQVTESSTLSDDSVHKAEATNQMVDGLADASQKIGEVVALITEIAEQTNLLALNATIEAARAGEAGKGFAVVASEVKNLASQTAQATDDISNQIQAIQSATGSSVAAIRDIGTNITSIAEVSGSITTAVDQQNAATQEISQSVQSASRASAEVTQTIVGVAQSAKETGQSADDVLAAARQLSTNAASLQKEVDSFLSEVRAG